MMTRAMKAIRPITR